MKTNFKSDAVANFPVCSTYLLSGTLPKYPQKSYLVEHIWVRQKWPHFEHSEMSPFQNHQNSPVKHKIDIWIQVLPTNKESIPITHHRGHILVDSSQEPGLTDLLRNHTYENFQKIISFQFNLFLNL